MRKVKCLLALTLISQVFGQQVEITGRHTSFVPNLFKNRSKDFGQLIDIWDETPGNATQRFHAYSQDNENAHLPELVGGGVSGAGDDLCIRYSTASTSKVDGLRDRMENHFHNGTTSLLAFGKMAHVGFSFCIEEQSEPTASWRLIHQWHQGSAPGCAVPVFGIYIAPGTSDELEFRLHYRREQDEGRQRGGVVARQKIAKGAWYDIVISMRGDIEVPPYNGELVIYLKRHGEKWQEPLLHKKDCPIGYHSKWTPQKESFDSHRTGIYQGHPNGAFALRVDNLRAAADGEWVKAINTPENP